MNFESPRESKNKGKFVCFHLKFNLFRITEMGGGVMRAVGKVSGVGIANATLRGGFHVSSPSSEHTVMRVAAATRSASSSPMAVSIEGASSVTDSTALGNQKSYWEMLDDWEFAGGVEQEVASEVSAPATGRGEPIARVLFGGVPSLEETQEATSDLKDALDKVYLSSPNYSGAGREPGVSLLSSSEETKDCVSYNVGAISVPQPAIHAFKLLNENPAVQSVVASIAADPNVWNAVLTNSAYMDFIKSQPTNDKFEYQASPRSSESSVKLEEYKDNDGADPFSDFLQKIKASVVEMVSKATNFFHGLFSFPSAEKVKENSGSNSTDKTIGASLMGLAVMVIMVVLVKRG